MRTRLSWKRTGIASTGSSPAHVAAACASFSIFSAFRNHLVNRDIRANGWVSNCQPGADRSPVDYAAIDPYRASLTAQWNAFLDFVANRVNTVNGVRYKDDPTIAVISIAGEPQPPASEECGKAVTTADLTDFYARTLGYLGSIDTHHLRSTGGLIHTRLAVPLRRLVGHRWPGDLRAADNTLPAVHTYPPAYAANGIPIDYQTPIVAAVANDLDKPWFTEEFGWTQSVGDATRASYFDWLYDEGRSVRLRRGAASGTWARSRPPGATTSIRPRRRPGRRCKLAERPPDPDAGARRGPLTGR